MVTEFILHEKEAQRAKEFIEKHSKCGCGLSYRFTLTPIGIGVDVECPNCGKIEDITDYDTW